MPEPGAVEAMTRLYNEGHTLILLTGRPVNKPNVYKAVRDWLEHFRIPVHQITNVKPDNYDFVIDNRAIHFDNWSSMMLQLRHLQNKQAEEKYIHEDTSLTHSQTNV